MATAEEIRIRLIAKDETEKAFKSSKRGVNGLKKAVFSLKGAFAALSVGGIVVAVKEATNFADSIGKTADKLGITTDALQEFRHAANLSGVEINTFDMAMQRFTRRAAEAAKGTGEAKAALQEMGIQLVDNEGNMRESSALLMDVADSFIDVESESERLRIAFKLFDSEGAALVNMLRHGGKALQKMRDDAKSLGIVMDEKLIRSAEDVKDKFATATSIISVQFKSAILELSPFLSDFAGWIKDIGTSFKEWRAIKHAGELKALHGLLELYRKGWEDMSAGLAEAGSRTEKATSHLIASMNKQKGSIEDVANKIVSLDDSIESVSISYDRVGHISEVVFTHMIAESKKAGDAIANNFAESEKAMAHARSISFQYLKELLGEEIITEEDMWGSSYARQLEALQAFHNKKLISDQQYAIAKRNIEKKVKEETIQTALDGFNALAQHNEKLFKIMKAVNIVNAIMDTYAGANKALAAYPPPWNYIAAAGVVAAGLANVATIKSQQFTPQRRFGGSVRAGEAVTVGEQGRETFVPQSNGTIVAGAGTAPSVNFTIVANDTAGFDDLLQSRRGHIIGMINQALNDQGRPALA